MSTIKPSREFDGSQLPVDLKFLAYVNTLNFGPGNRDQSGYLAFLRAGGLEVNPDAALDEVVKRIQASGGTYDPAKFKSQLHRAYEYAGVGAADTKALIKPPKPVFIPVKLKNVAAKAPGINADWLRRHSPIPVAGITSAQYLNAVYSPGEKIVIFTEFESQGQVIYEVGAGKPQPLPDRSPDGVWYLVQPVDGKEHPNPRLENKPSCRSQESVTSWRYLVLENDEAEQNEWLACLVQLPLKLVAIYTSGGKSIHALVKVDAVSKQDWDLQRDQMRPIVVTLGADNGALTAVRLSRLPGTMRGDKKQELLYLNPKATIKPIHTHE